MNRSPIKPMSEKRRAALAAAGVVHPSSTLATVPMFGKPTLRTVAAKRFRDTGPDAAAVDAVLERDGHSCVVCGGGLHGQRGVDWSVHHRKLRSRGGDNSPANLISVCGNGTQGDHGAIHAAPLKATAAGWMLHTSADPEYVIVAHALHGFVFLRADGSCSSRRPAAEPCGDELHGGDGVPCPSCGFDSHPIPSGPTPPMPTPPWETTGVPLPHPQA